MRILLFGSSGDLVTDDDGQTAFQRVCAAVEQHTHGSIEATFAFAYPSATLADYVRRRVAAVEPDVVLLHCNGSPVGHESLELGLRARFGGRLPAFIRVGRDVARHALAAAFDPAAGVPYRPRPGLRPALYRRLVTLLIVRGYGATVLSVDEVAASYAAAIRAVLAQEPPVVLVRGPGWAGYHHDNPPVQRRALRRLAALDARVAAVCADRRVPFYSIRAHTAATAGRDVGGDGFHRSAASVAGRAEVELAYLLPLLAP